MSAHDNETIFDAVQAKTPTGTLLADRIRMNNVALDLVMLGQGVPFFHAGDELLRSKSLDRNSYNSGDWFNQLDFTYASNKWAVGLPLAGDNADKWPVIKPLLADTQLKPQKADILGALSHFEEMLKIRKSSQLFRLHTGAEVMQHLTFLNTGLDQTPGLISLRLSNSGADRIADPFGEIVVLFNSSSQDQTFVADELKGLPFELHPIQAASSDTVIKNAKFDQDTFTVPARTTTVFVVTAENLPQPAATVAATALPAAQATAVPPTAAPTQAPTPPQATPPAVARPASASSPVLPIVVGGAIVLAASAGLFFYRRRTK